MELVVRAEQVLDRVETARLAAEAFGPGATFRSDRIGWLYEKAFSESTAVLGLFAGEQKVGQVALVGQPLQLGSTAATAIALMDLFILKPFRSRDAITRLYSEVEQLCRDRGLRFILAVPNGNAAGVNQRFLGLKPFLKLDIRAGVAVAGGGGTLISTQAATLTEGAALALFERYLPVAGNGLAWTAGSLWQRLQDPSASYGVHATDNLLLISSPRTSRRLPHTLLCAFLARRKVGAAEVRAVTAAACRLQRRPLFIYAGVNAAVPLPGWSLPERVRPSPMVVQIRDFNEPATPVGFDRFELLDFDFA